MTKTNIGIIGHGEIGSSIEKLYLGKSKYTVFIKDIERDDGLEGIDFLHICIPFSDKFIDQVVNYIEIYNPTNTIINSTVLPGTTDKIINLTRNTSIAHSPVRGVHPKLYEGLITFQKYVGVQEESSFSDVVKVHFMDIGVDSVIVTPTKASELAKLLSTTYYGLCIAWHGEVQELCNKYNVDFDTVSTLWNQGYNEGYTKLGMSNVCRPVLYPPSDKIGGHCVVSNAELMSSFFESRALELILKYK